MLDEIIRPTVAALAGRGIAYRGVLYAGLMVTPDGPKLIEYNARFGDPECQVLMPRLKDDLLTILKATADGVLDQISVRWRDEAALSVVMATNGYPGAYETGSEIWGLSEAAALPGVEIFHAATKREGDRFFAAGGRVLAVTATGRDVAEAQARAYAAVDAIDWPQGFCRRDIGWRAIDRKVAAEPSRQLTACINLRSKLYLCGKHAAATFPREGTCHVGGVAYRSCLGGWRRPGHGAYPRLRSF